MIERFDHAVIGIPDLAEGMETFRRLGFEVTAGGRHPSLGTRNAIVRFGLDYLELLSVEHPEKAQSRGRFGAELISFLEQSSGLVGFVLAGTGLEEQADGFRTLLLGAEGPFDMDRVRPDGRRLEWRLVVPGGSPWRKPWPYLIDWITPESDLLAWDPPGRHECGATGVAGIDLVVDDLKSVGHMYRNIMGMQAERTAPVPKEGAIRCTSYRIESFRLRLFEPASDGPAADEWRRRGAGPYRLLLTAADLPATARMLSANAIPYSETTEGLNVDPDAAAGARIRFVPS